MSSPSFLSISFTPTEAYAVSFTFEGDALHVTNMLEHPTLGGEILGQLHTSTEDIPSPRWEQIREQLKGWLGAHIAASSRFAITLPPPESLHLNVRLPVVDPKSLEKMLRLELQDTLPFDPSEFHLSAVPTGQATDDGFDVEVSLLRRSYLQDLLENLRGVEIDPAILTSPEAALGALPSLTAQPLAENFSVVLRDSANIYLSTFLNGALRRARIIPRVSLNGASGSWGEAVLRQIEMTVLQIEHETSTPIDEVVFLKEGPEAPVAEECLGRPVRTLLPEEISPLLSEKNLLPLFSGMYLYDRANLQLTTNFRSGPFRYRPQLRYLIAAGRRLALPASLCLAMLTLYLLVSYVLAGYQISHLQQAMSEEIHGVIASAPLSRGQELRFVQEQIGALHSQLEDIGVISQLSPVETIVRAVGKLGEAPKGTEVTELKASSSRLEIEGFTPSYSAIDNLSASFRADSENYCAVKDESQSIRNRRFKFSLRIDLCQQGGPA